MKARPIEIVIEGGRELARVPLGRKNKYEPLRYAELWKDDYDFLRKLGLSANWAAYRVKNQQYVTASAPTMASYRILVARALLDAGKGMRVKFVDGNPMNLRRENLRLVAHGGATHRARNHVFSN